MDRPQTATSNCAVRVSPDLREERREDYMEPPGAARHGAIETALVDPVLAQQFHQLV